jgi:hypothetical protein
MNMQTRTVIILGTGVLLAAGVGAYELATRTPVTYQTPYSLQAETPTAAVGSLAPGIKPIAVQTAPNTSVPVNTVPVNQVGSTGVLPSVSPEIPVSGTPPTLSPETPVSAVPPLPGNAYEEKTTTETTTTRVGPAPHRAYVHRHYAHYKRNDKVHVARAAKHTNEFALKLPGRLAF